MKLPPNRAGGLGGNPGEVVDHDLTDDCATTARNGKSPARCVSSRAVSWWSVHEYVAPVLARCHDPIPMVGSVAWQQLPDDHPAKIAAVFDAARHWALRVDTCQEASAEASRAISDAADWSDVAEQIRGRREFLAENPWAKRRPA